MQIKKTNKKKIRQRHNSEENDKNIHEWRGPGTSSRIRIPAKLTSK